NSLVNTIVRVYTSERRVRETPLAGIETVALVDEGGEVALASQGFATEDRLSSIGVARPLVQDKNPGEVTNIHDSLKQLARQVVECHAWTLAAHVQRSQLLAAPARNLGTTQVDSESLCVFDEPSGDFNHFHPWHRQPQDQTQVGG